MTQESELPAYVRNIIFTREPAASQSCREGAGGMGECEIEVRDQRWLVIAKIERTSS